MFEGKFKAVTFSYDDGVLQDKRLIEILNKYGLKCTFNLNSGFLGKSGSLVRNDVTVAHCKPRVCETRAIYEGHEVAVHTIHHPQLTKLSTKKVIREVEDDRKALSDIVGYEVVGMAYPCSTEASQNDRVVSLLQRFTGVQYSRNTVSSYNFEPQADLLRFRPTLHHTEWNELFRLGEEFVSLKTDKPKIFYIWGHSYEFDISNDWNKFEEFCRLISGKDDIYYGTNKDVLLDPDLLSHTGVKLHSYRKRKPFEK